MLDRQAPIPLYYQLSEILQQRIAAGELRPGQQLAAEDQLASEYGISRMTVRQALDELVRKELLVRRQGRGTYVSQPKVVEAGLPTIMSFTEDMRRQGIQPASRILRSEIVRAPAAVSAALGTRDRVDCVYLERVRLADGEPVVLQAAYILPKFCRGLLEQVRPNLSLHAFLAGKGVTLAYSRLTIECRKGRSKEASQLQVRPAFPVFDATSIYFDRTDRAVYYAKSIYRSDKYKFEMLLRSETLLRSEAEGTGYRSGA